MTGNNKLNLREIGGAFLSNMAIENYLQDKLEAASGTDDQLDVFGKILRIHEAQKVIAEVFGDVSKASKEDGTDK